MARLALALALGLLLASASTASALTLRTRAFIAGESGTAVCWFHNVSGASKTAVIDFVNLAIGPGDPVRQTCTDTAAGAGCSLDVLVKGLTPIYCAITVDAKASEVRGGALVIDGAGNPLLSFDAN